MKKKKKKNQLQETKARRRAEVIMKVRSGLMTATQGAAALGISRKTYYKWENRALGAMLGELEDRDCGRPELPEPLQHEIDLNRKIEQLQREKELLERKIELKELIHEFELDRTRKAGLKSIKKKK